MKSIDFKRRLVGTALGRFLYRGDQWRDLISSMRKSPERLGRISQDLCAHVILPHLSRQSATFVDVGSHIGSVVDSVQQRSKQIKIIAVEAVPDKAIFLRKKFPDIKVHDCAVGDSDGEVQFFVDLERPGFSSLSSNSQSNRAVREIKVTIRRLDDLVDASDLVDVIKLDVEGAELGVLRGSEELTKRCRPAFYFESGLKEHLGYTHEDLFAWFAERAYQVFVPDRLAHNGSSLTREGFLEAHVYPPRTLNYFGIPSERRNEFRDRARNALNISVSD